MLPGKLKALYISDSRKILRRQMSWTNPVVKGKGHFLNKE